MAEVLRLKNSLQGHTHMIPASLYAPSATGRVRTCYASRNVIDYVFFFWTFLQVFFFYLIRIVERHFGQAHVGTIYSRYYQAQDYHWLFFKRMSQGVPVFFSSSFAT